MMRLAFLASHNGSSGLAITEACRLNGLAADPALLISNNETSNALFWARASGLFTAIVNAKTAVDPDAAIAALLVEHKIDLVACSGYMKLVGPKTIAAVKGRILNIHPALLPKYGGQGMYGSHVHAAVAAAGDEESGITIHLVSDEYDRGGIIAQKRVALSPGDNAAAIEAKVRAEEAAFYVETMRGIVSGNVPLP